MGQTISLSDVGSNIKKHLSVIGKRFYDKNGKNLFSNITVSSAEEGIFNDYINAAAQNIAGALAQFDTSYSNTSISVNSARWDSETAKALQNAAESYALFFSIGEYLAMTHPELATKYQQDAQGMMHTIVSTAYYKAPPSVSANPTEATASVS